MKQLPKIGERLVIHRMSQYTALVESVEWSDESFDWLINLSWGEHGRSKVWFRDENNVWFRWSSQN